MKTLISKFQSLAGTFLSVLLVVASMSAYAQLNVEDIGGFVSADEAQEWMSNFEFENQGGIFGHLYGKQTLNEILAQEGAQGIKIFNGLDKAGTAKIVFYAANGNGEQIGMAYDISKPCPPFCGSPPGGGGDDDYTDIGSIGNPIDLAVADQWIRKFEVTLPNEVSSFVYGKKVFQTMLKPQQVEGIFFAHGKNEQGLSQLLLVSVDGEGTLLMNKPVAGNGKGQVNALLSANR